MGYDIESLKPTLPPLDYDGLTGDEFWKRRELELEAGDIARFNITAWPKLLALATSFGWIPAGTEPGPLDEPGHEPSIEHGYLVNQGRVVNTDDAWNLADALERALPNLSEYEEPGKFTHLENKSDAISGALFRAMGGDDTVIYGPSDDMPEYKYFGGDMKETIIRFIRLCRKGAFQIS